MTAGVWILVACLVCYAVVVTIWAYRLDAHVERMQAVVEQMVRDNRQLCAQVYRQLARGTKPDCAERPVRRA